MASRYKAYPEYKDSGIEWLGEVPTKLNIIRLKHIFEIVKRIAGTLGHDVLSITQRGIKVKDIESGEGQLSMDYSKYQIINIGDFAMNHMDLLTGYVDISKYEGVTSPDYRVFRLNEESSYDAKYYLYLLQMGYQQKIFFPLGQGSAHLGRWRLPTDAFNEIEYPCPTKKEQKQIADFLDVETAKIDTLIAKQEKLIELLKEKVIALTLRPFKGESSSDIRIGNVIDIISRPVHQKMGEEYIPIGLYNRGRGLFHKEPRLKQDMGESDFFWVKEGDLILSGQFAWEGAVALADKSDSGCVVSHRYPVLRGKKGIALTEYIYSLFLTHHGDFLLNESSRGAAGRNRPLNINSLLKEKIFIPTIEEQEEIAFAVHCRYKIMKLIKKEIRLLQERKTALISAAVTGKIDVRHHVSNPINSEQMELST